MDYEINCTISVKIKEDQLNINGLITVVHDFVKQILGVSFLKKIIEEVDKINFTSQKAQSPKKYINRGYQSRQIQTSMGKLNLNFIKAKNIETGKTSCPGKELWGISSYSTWPVETIINSSSFLPFMSYRNSASEFQEQHGTGPSKSVLHRRVSDIIGTGEYQPNLMKKRYRYLIVDGTKARFQDRAERKEEMFYQGEVRFAYASIGEGKPFELVGLWINKTWKECSSELYSRLDSEKLEVLICDGETAISNAFLKSAMRHQRCQWHGARELKFILYADGVKKKEQTPIIAQLEKIQMVGSRQKTFEKLTQKDADSLIEIRNNIVNDIKELAEHTIGKGYTTAGTYLQNLAEPFVACLDYYLETGEHIPITSNIIERQIGLFKNRYNRVGKRWSEAGLQRWFAIAIRKLLPQFKWSECWETILGSKSAVMLKLQTCSIT